MSAPLAFALAFALAFGNLSLRNSKLPCQVPSIKRRLAGNMVVVQATAIGSLLIAGLLTKFFFFSLIEGRF
jgi:hypothetical protein